MKAYEFKEPTVVHSGYLLADKKTIQPRLIRLAALLEQITEKLVDCTFAAFAHGCIQTAIKLELINFDVMKVVVEAMEDVQVCSVLVTSRETACDDLVKEAEELASDIFADLPIGIGITPTAPDDELADKAELISAKLIGIVEGKVLDGEQSAFMTIGGKVVQISSELYSRYGHSLVASIGHEIAIEIVLQNGDYFLSGVIEARSPEIIPHGKLTGYVRNLKRMVTKKHELMATFDLKSDDGTCSGIVAFPRTFHRYREMIEWYANYDFQVAITIQLDKGEEPYPHILDEMQSLFIKKSVLDALVMADKNPIPSDLLVRITQDLPDDETPFSAGDTGRLQFWRKERMWGFRSERYGTLSFSRMVDGQKHSILDFLELVDDDNDDTRPLPELSEGELE